jgi:TPR repeat protein
VILGYAWIIWDSDFRKGLTAYKRGDYATALHEWTPLAEQGDAYTQFSLGVMYLEGRGVSQDDKTAAIWFRRAAEQGVVQAQHYLGVMYEHGRGVLQDEKAAVTWYRRAAEQGYAGAQFDLGLMYYHGRGVPQDDKTAAMWFRRAAEQGDAQGNGLNKLLTSCDFSKSTLLRALDFGDFACPALEKSTARPPF